MNESRASLVAFYKSTSMYILPEGTSAGTGARAGVGALETAGFGVLVLLSLVKASPASSFLLAGRGLRQKLRQVREPAI